MNPGIDTYCDWLSTRVLEYSLALQYQPVRNAQKLLDRDNVQYTRGGVLLLGRRILRVAYRK